jgi:hypothetical protein
MNCDSGFNKKLNEFVLSKFLNCHSTNMFVGAPGSGKTSLVVSFFKSKEMLNKVYHNVFLFQPSHSISSMKDDIFDSIDNKYNELTYENLEGVMNQIKEEENKYCNCIIFDDMGAYLKNKDIKKLLKELIYNRRHLRTSIFFLCQTYLSIEKDIRKLFSNLFVFRVSKKELELIFDEVVEQAKELVLPISKLVYDTKYNFLFINTDSGRLFKNFDEILIDE